MVDILKFDVYKTNNLEKKSFIIIKENKKQKQNIENIDKKCRKGLESWIDKHFCFNKQF